MSILTHDEAKRLSQTSTDPLEVIRNVEAAVIAKLCAGVEMPEPAAYAGKTQAGKWKYTTGSIGSAKTWLLYQEREYLTKGLQIVPLFTADQLQIAIAAARVKALEDAAALAEHENAADWSISGQIARQIRALKGGAA